MSEKLVTPTTISVSKEEWNEILDKLNRLEKYDKVIRIIAKKQVDMVSFMLTDKLKDYNNTVFWVKNELTKKEHDLLKEVFDK